MTDSSFLDAIYDDNHILRTKNALDISRSLNDAKLLLETQPPDGLIDRQLNTTCILDSKAGLTELVMQMPKDALLCANVFGETPLTIAACSGNLPLLTWLIRTLHPDLKFTTWEGKTLLALAAENGRLSCVTYLLSIGCESSHECARPLELAANGGFLDVLEALAPHSTKDDVSDAFVAALSKSRLHCCELLLRIGNIDTDSIYDSSAWTSWLETNDEAFVLWLLNQLSNTPSMAPKLSNVAHWMKAAACWTPGILERVLACMEVEVSADLFSRPEFWEKLCAHGNMKLLQWLLERQIGPRVAVPSTLPAAKREAEYLALRLRMTERLLESRTIAMARQLEERDAYMKEMTRGNDRSHEMELLLSRALEANNLEGLDWLCDYMMRPLEVIFHLFHPRQLIKYGAEAMIWLMRRGWKPEENLSPPRPSNMFLPSNMIKFGVETVKWLMGREWRQEETPRIRSLSLKPHFWPTVHTTCLTAQGVLETLQLLDKTFEWTGEELSAGLWPRESEQRLSYLSAVNLCPLAWAAYHGYHHVIDWLVFDKKARWDLIAPSHDDCGELLYSCALGNPSPSIGDGKMIIDPVSMAKYLRRVAKVPLPRRESPRWPHLRTVHPDDPLHLLHKMPTSSCSRIINFWFDEYLAQLIECGAPQASSHLCPFSMWLPAFTPTLLWLIQHMASVFSNEPWLDMQELAARKANEWLNWIRASARRSAVGCPCNAAHRHEKMIRDCDKFWRDIWTKLLSGFLAKGDWDLAAWTLAEGGSPMEVERLSLPMRSRRSGLKWLRRQGVDMHKAALAFASIIMHTDDLPSLQYLLKHGANIFCLLGPSGYTSITLAQRFGSPRILAFLQQQGFLSDI